MIQGSLYLQYIDFILLVRGVGLASSYSCDVLRVSLCSAKGGKCCPQGEAKHSLCTVSSYSTHASLNTGEVWCCAPSSVAQAPLEHWGGVVLCSIQAPPPPPLEPWGTQAT